MTAATVIGVGQAVKGAISPRQSSSAIADDIPAIKNGEAGGPTAGERFPKSVREQAFLENPRRVCVFCGREGGATQVDHAIPKSLGGNATIENAQLACQHCNLSKGARTFPMNPPSGYTGPWPPPWWPFEW